ncbi:hypothetical protein [[Clostridium] fimetarium]|uniref:Uncharacterized protein n=1 Tax=[Clostridium] fimetarium TaxID=99656 RepID=A0A1I0QVY4_9FIRM|nr:hypothetical protein [[Clostridium] fimetarium]SEW31642.1 hypothetical protein SAMN05421659_109168 [[Clostridium] fimetarium]
MENLIETPKKQTKKIFVYDELDNPPIGVVDVNLDLVDDMDKNWDKDEYYMIMDITRLEDGRYVEITYYQANGSFEATVISEKDALLTILDCKKEYLFQLEKFQDLKKIYDKLVFEMKE